MKLCLLLLFMVLGCFAITNVRTTTVQEQVLPAHIRKAKMDLHLIRYCINKFPDVTNRLRNRQDISSTDFLMERNCIFQVLTMKEQVLPAHIRKAKMDLNLNEARWY